MSEECAASLEILLETCKELGIPVAVHKCMGPTTYLVFLGILIDTHKMEISLPEENLEQLKEILAAWKDRKDCTKRELQSLIGHLQHAATVVRPGRRFIQSMISLLHVAHKPHHHIRLNTSFRAAWSTLVAHFYHGMERGFYPIYIPAQTAISWHRVLYRCFWVMGLCSTVGEAVVSASVVILPSFASASIAPKELLPIVLAASTWGHLWRGKTILCHLDNEAVASVINSGSCKEPHLAHVIRYLFFIEAKFYFIFTARHIPGKSNTEADALLRGGHQFFLSSHPQANLLPTLLRPGLIESLTSVAPDWMSPSWIQSFSASFSML